MRVELVAARGAATHHKFRSRIGQHIYVADASRVYDLPASMTAADLAQTLRFPNHDLSSVELPSAQNISLNVSAACNLSCAYCYAAKGQFGGAQKGVMNWSVAQSAIDRLLVNSDRQFPVTIGFLGGEPFVNARLIHRAVRYARRRGNALGQDVRFSVTTNATLLRAQDHALMRDNPFAVTVSIDGDADTHQRQRPGSTFMQVVNGISPLLNEPGAAKVCARATVSNEHFDLSQRLDAIEAVGFQDIGFSPVRTGSSEQVISGGGWRDYQASLLTLGERELQRLLTTGRSTFANLVIALKQIHRGAASPYPCGAGGGYFSVATDGSWYACHRAIGDPTFKLGDNQGIDHLKREQFLGQRHVHAKTDCSSCWARYLCSGGCHQEASARSDASCDVIRAWLDFCLRAYCELTEQHPHWFDSKESFND